MLRRQAVRVAASPASFYFAWGCFRYFESGRRPLPTGYRRTAAPSAIHPGPRPLPAELMDWVAPRCAPAAADDSRRLTATAPAASGPAVVPVAGRPKVTAYRTARAG